MSSSFSARWVWSITPLSRASAAASRIRPVETENGEHGARPTRTIASGARVVEGVDDADHVVEDGALVLDEAVGRQAAGALADAHRARASGGSGCRRSAAASIVSSSRTPFG